MFAALKRMTGKGETSSPGGPPATPRPGLQSMAHNLQRKFARGVQYNMKIIIKGDRNVGKTALFHRLKGEKFIEEYAPTEEIQVASIQWSYKATDDVVKVEVWDVVDRGKKKKRIDGLKLDNVGPINDLPEEPALDAEFLDVYKGTNGVIMVLDITKNWTFEYVQRELPKVPAHIPVLVLANHCDMSHHRVITPDHIIYYIESQQRPEGCAQIRYAESSMRNGFGLKYLHKFLNLPFLQLQRETLLAQLETNGNETTATVAELDAFQAGPDADYNQFLENLVNKRRQVAESTSTAGTQAQSFSGVGHAPSSLQHSSTSHQLSSSSTQATDASIRRSSSNPGPVGPIGGGHVIGGGQPIPGAASITSVVSSSSVASSTHTPAQPTPEKNVGSDVIDGIADSGKKQSGLMSKLFGKKDLGETEKRLDVSFEGTSKSMAGGVVSVEEFIPDGGVIDRSFLEDSTPAVQNTTIQQSIDSDSDVEPDGNPLVAGFQDDIDSDEDLTQPLPSVAIADAETENDPDDEDLSPVHVTITCESPAYEITASGSPVSVRKLSSASSIGKKSVQEEGSLDGEVSTITGDALDAWFSSDSKLRRSPEGGEDINSRASVGSRGSRDGDLTSSTQPTSSLSERKKKTKNQKELEKEDDKGSIKKHKKKSKDKDKDKEREKKKKSVKKLQSEERSRDELEEFLNGSTSSPVESAYEAL